MYTKNKLQGSEICTDLRGVLYTWLPKKLSDLSPFSVPVIREKNGKEMKIVEVNIGGDAKLGCQIRTNGQNPKPRYYWLKNNDTLSTADHPRMRSKPYKYLKIKRVRKEDAGFYTCVAVNVCGENSYTMQLFIERK